MSADGPGSALRPRRLVLAITAGPGAIFGVRILECLSDSAVETHLVVSDAGKATIAAQTGRGLDSLSALAHRTYHVGNQASQISSGSFITDGMVVAPCSTNALGAIAIGLAGNLVHRAADVMIKERRKLVLLVRDAPLSPLHEECVRRLSGLATVITPPVRRAWPTAEPSMDHVDVTVRAVLAEFGLDRCVAAAAGG